MSKPWERQHTEAIVHCPECHSEARCPCTLTRAEMAGGIMNPEQADNWVNLHGEKYGHKPRIVAVRAIDWRGNPI